MKRMRGLILLSAAMVLLAGCSSTTINGVWKDPQYSGGKLDRVLVVSVAKSDLMRRLYEDAFVARFNQLGIQATPGHKVLPAGHSGDPRDIDTKLGELGYRNVLVTRLTEQRTIEILHPGTTYIDYPDRRYYYRNYPYYRHWRDYYDRGYAIIETTPPYTTRSELVVLETNVYDANDEIIFSVQTETLVDYGAEETIRDIVNAILTALRDKQLI